jgi:hypothetical protein
MEKDKVPFVSGLWVTQCKFSPEIGSSWRPALDFSGKVI